MAAVPGILYICDGHGQGGVNGLPAAIDTINGDNLRFLLDRDVQRITPDSDANGVPNAAALGLWPWYDGSASLTDYTIASSTTTTITASGSPGWTTNQWAGRMCSVRNSAPIPGLGFASRFFVASNTANTLTFGALGAAPTPGASFMLGEGVMLDYHPAAGKLHPSEFGAVSRRGGSSWQTLNNGVGPDATMLRALWKRVYTTSPFFYLCKYAGDATVNGGWAEAPNNTARAQFLAEFARMNAAAVARSNTIAWADCIIDLSMTDLVAAGASPVLAVTYESRLREMIAWLRSAAVCNNPALRIVLVSHREDMWGTTSPLGAPLFRAAHRAIARDLDNVGILDMEGAAIGLQIAAADTPATEKKYYTQAEYFRYGERVADVLEQLQLGTAPTASGGFPVYYMIGDSIQVGEAVLGWTSNSLSRDISGPTPGSVLRPENQLIWNDATSVFETYNPHTNSNTSGTGGSTAGPDLSIMAELGRLHPTGFGLVKRGSGGSGLASSSVGYSAGNNGRWVKSVSGEHYTALLGIRDRVHQYVNQVLGKQVDVRGFFVSLGHNDQATANGGANFAAALPQFCEDLWEDFPTRTSGNRPPITWRRPQSDAAGAVAVEMAKVRSAIDERQQAEQQFRVIDVDGLERRRDDNLHETPETAVIHGRRAVGQLAKAAI